MASISSSAISTRDSGRSRAIVSSSPSRTRGGRQPWCTPLLLGFSQPVAYLLSGQRQLNVIAPVDEHFASDDDDIRSKPQRSLDLANQNGFTVVDARFGDETKLLVVGAADRQADNPLVNLSRRCFLWCFLWCLLCYGLRYGGE